MDEEFKIIKSMLENKRVKSFVVGNLKTSLKGIGYSKELIQDLINQFEKYDFTGFQLRNSEELHEVHSIGFFQKIVPIYFENQVIPYVPSSKKVVDIGCGTGILAYKLAQSKRFDQIIGIDINSYPEWNKFKGGGVSFKIVKEKEFREFLKETKPETIILTWALHHMDFKKQEEYLREIHSILDKVIIVVLEDSFSVKMQPQEDIGVYESFNKLNLDEKNKVMSILDWTANRVLERRDKTPIPFTYRSLEDWQKLFEEIGFKLIKKKYIGFPENRDINTPQSIIVVSKV